MNRRHFLALATASVLMPACGLRRTTAARAAIRGWHKLPTVPFRGKQEDMAFGTPADGWYGNGEGRLHATSDGGDSWEQVWHSPGTYIRALGFLDARNGILGNVGVGAYPNVSDGNPLYWTADGGRSWTAARIDGPTPGGVCGIDIFRPAGNALPVAHAAGRVRGPARYLRSRDGGRSWTRLDLAAQTMAIFDVKFLSRRTGFIAGASGPDPPSMRGLVLRSDDGGDSWREVFRSSRPYETVWKLHFASGRPVMAVSRATTRTAAPARGTSPRAWTAARAGRSCR